MKVLLSLAIILGSFIIYVFLKDDSLLPLEGEELKQVLSSQSYEEKALTETFEIILEDGPKSEPQKLVASYTELENASAKEIYIQLEEELEKGRKPGADFARSVMFSHQISYDVKEDLLEMLRDGQFDQEDFRYLTREILGRPSMANSSIFRKALLSHAEILNPSQRKILIQELLERTPDPEKRQIIMDLEREL